jgi:hypothetical protein
MKKNNFNIIIFFLISSLTYSVLMLCNSSKPVKNGAGGGSGNNKTENNASTLEYEKEGFISNDTFRIVIVNPEGVPIDSAEIEKIARQRALMSLQKHLSSSERIIDQNTRAKLLNLIEQNGKLTRHEEGSKTRDVYFFDIKKDDLNGYLNSCAPRR